MLLKKCCLTTSSWNSKERENSLFHKFNEGVKVGKDMWYSVTPEDIASLIALRAECLVKGVRDSPSAYYSNALVSCIYPSHSLVFDAFCGIGGNAIQFAKFTHGFVIGMDISFQCLLKLQHNCQVYGVSTHVDCIMADATRLPFRKCTSFFDIAFLSPPWGGPQYRKKSIISLQDSISLGFQMLDENLAKTIIYYLPRNLHLHDLNYLFEKKLVCFLEGYLNRSGRFHFSQKISHNSVGCRDETPMVSSETLASLWYPMKQNSWSWNLSVVTVWIGALANVAYKLFHSPISRLKISKNNNDSRKKFFLVIWDTTKNALHEILGVSGTVPYKTAYRHHHIHLNYILRPTPCKITRYYLKKCCEKKFLRLHHIKSHNIVKKKIEKNFFAILLKKQEGATLHLIVLQLECVKQLRGHLFSELFNFLDALSKKVL